LRSSPPTWRWRPGGSPDSTLAENVNGSCLRIERDILGDDHDRTEFAGRPGETQQPLVKGRISRQGDAPEDYSGAAAIVAAAPFLPAVKVEQWLD
jgi:hypothetical protein